MRRAFLVLALVAAAAAAWASARVLNDSRIVRPFPEKAFLNAEWGMSPENVAFANDTQLREVPSQQYASDASGRDRSYEQREDVVLLGRPGRIVYTFRDEKLSAYHVFVSDGRADVLDQEMRRHLARRFGGRYSEVNEDSLKLMWQFSDRIVNYWFYEDEKAPDESRYRAGFGVNYTALESA